AVDGEPKEIEFASGDQGGRFCLNGQRLVAVAGVYGEDGTEYRTEPDGFAKIQSLGSDGEGPQTFRVYAKDGTILTYGDQSGLNSVLDGQRFRVYAGGTDTSQHVRMAWALSRIEDRFGNYLTVRYQKTVTDLANEQHPVEINYTGIGGQAPGRAIKLFYEARPDAYVAWNAGFKTKLTGRLSRIEAHAPNPDATQLVRSYQ